MYNSIKGKNVNLKINPSISAVHLAIMSLTEKYWSVRGEPKLDEVLKRAKEASIKQKWRHYC